MRPHVYSLLLVVAARFAEGANAATRDEQTKNCKGDAIRFCATDIPNEQKITACMKAHYEALTPGCKAMFKAPPRRGPKNKTSVPHS
jgi:hypothetical protein